MTRITFGMVNANVQTALQENTQRLNDTMTKLSTGEAHHASFRRSCRHEFRVAFAYPAREAKPVLSQHPRWAGLAFHHGNGHEHGQRHAPACARAGHPGFERYLHGHAEEVSGNRGQESAGGNRRIGQIPRTRASTSSLVRRPRHRLIRSRMGLAGSPRWRMPTDNP